MKDVKFRVEFSARSSLANSPVLASPDLRGQYPTRVTIVMERGAGSTFKAVYNQLRAHWECVNFWGAPLRLEDLTDELERRLDDPRTPSHLAAVRLVPSPMPSPALGNRSPVFA